MDGITYDKVVAALTYDPTTGVFTWKNRSDVGAWWNNRFAGKGVSNYKNPKGYVRFQVFGKMVAAHRLAWLYMVGEWPTNQIDHLNRDKTDNRWSNLAQSTQSQNLRNRSSTFNTSGRVGVTWHKGRRKWQARLFVDGRDVFLGRFDRFEEAVAARAAAEANLDCRH